MTTTERCETNSTISAGPAANNCDQPPEFLLKVFATNLKGYNEAAYDMLARLQLSTQDAGTMLNDWRYTGRSNTWSVAPRDAVCKWVAENYKKGAKWNKQVPSGFPKTLDKHVISSGSKSALTALGIVGIVSNVLIFFWINANKNHQIIKRSQPVFLQLILVGGIFLFVAVTLAGNDASYSTCQAQAWLGHIGFVMLFLPLLIKLYRVAVLFNNKRLRRLTMSNSLLLRRIGAGVIVMAIYLFVWMIIAPVQDVTTVEGVRSKVLTTVKESTFCTSDTPAFGFACIACEFALLLWGVSLCVQTRGISEDFAETKYIAFGIYNTTIVALICLILLFGFETNPTVVADISGIGIFFTVVMVEAAIYVPKIMFVVYNIEISKNMTGTAETAATSAGNQVSPASSELSHDGLPPIKPSNR